MRKILQVVQHLRPGGLEKLVVNLMLFASPAHRVFIVSLENTAEEVLHHWPELHAYQDRLFFLNKPAGVTLNVVSQLRQLIEQHGITTLHSHHLGPLLYSRLALFGSTITHIHTEHDSWHLQHRKQQYMTRWLLKGTNIEFVADAPSVAKELQQYLGITAKHVIFNGIDSQFYCIGDPHQARHQLKLPPTAPLIGCAGRLVEEKGIDTLLHALAHLPTHFQLVVAGDGDQATSLKQLAHQLKVNKRVHWLGYCHDMRTFYQAITLFCMPSRQEGLPLALLEAQACGKAIVASHIGAIPDFTYPKSRLLVPPEQPQQLAQALKDSHEMAPNAQQTAHFIQQLADVRTMTRAYEALAK